MTYHAKITQAESHSETMFTQSNILNAILNGLNVNGKRKFTEQ